MMISSTKASSKLGYLWRVCGTGLGFVGFGVGGLAIGTVLAPMVRVLHKDKYKQEIHAQKIIQKGFMGFMQSLKGLGVMTYDVQGLDKLQDSYGELVVANHPTLIDVVMLIACMPRANCVVKQALYNNPFTHGPVKSAGYILNGASSKGATGASDSTVDDFMHACIAKLTKPMGDKPAGSLVIFPEGTRTKKGQTLGDFARGWANIALRADVPIRPVVITCTPSTLTKNEKWYHIPDRPFHLQLRVLDAVSLADVLGDDYDKSPKTARKLNAWLYDFFQKELNCEPNARNTANDY